MIPLLAPSSWRQRRSPARRARGRSPRVVHPPSHKSEPLGGARAAPVGADLLANERAAPLERDHGNDTTAARRPAARQKGSLAPTPLASPGSPESKAAQRRPDIKPHSSSPGSRSGAETAGAGLAVAQEFLAARSRVESGDC